MLEPEVIYEDDDLLIINKPAGLLTHAVNRNDASESVVTWLLRRHPEIAQVKDEYGEGVGEWVDLRPGIVHRLDRETSGILVIAKHQASFNYLKDLFKNRAIKKNYLALVYGHLKEKQGVIDLPLGKLGTRQSTRIKGTKELKEKNAITEFKVVKEFEKYSLLEVTPLTGRTHQIRVHLRSLGHPIVCDPIYAEKSRVCPPGLGRLFLHAFRLQFVSPSGRALSVEADPPPELANFLSSLEALDNPKDLR